MFFYCTILTLILSIYNQNVPQDLGFIDRNVNVEEYLAAKAELEKVNSELCGKLTAKTKKEKLAEKQAEKQVLKIKKAKEKAKARKAKEK